MVKKDPLWCSFDLLFPIIEVIIIVVYGLTIELADTHDEIKQGWIYPMFQDVNVMIFLGIGFLYAFLRNFSWSSLCFNFLLGLFSIQISILFRGLWHALFTNNWSKISLDITTITNGEFSAATVLISLGGYLGTLTINQMFFLAIGECIFVTLNEAIMIHSLQGIDTGGSMFLHAFGCYYGLSVCLVLKPKAISKYRSTNYYSNIFAFLGTLLLWVYWPSFISILAEPQYQIRALMNSFLSILSSALWTFWLSRILNKDSKFEMEDILNATLAGGVAIGTTSDMNEYFFVPLLVGALAGMLSTLGYHYITPWLERTIGLIDVAGINNLHGMPGIMGGFVGFIVILCKLYDKHSRFVERGILKQAGYQLATLFVSLGIAIASGLLFAYYAKVLFNPLRTPFEDDQHCVMEEGQQPLDHDADQEPLKHEERAEEEVLI